ncbi:kinase-like domain-containing protein [Mycena floridula]|nr:kinase-like domain-containing protein [Mycena floridula]
MADIVSLLYFSCVRRRDVLSRHRHSAGHYFAFGEFSDVYRGVPTTSGQVKEVALKVMGGRNASDTKSREISIEDIASGISYLHEHNIVHGDIPGANVFVTAEGRAVLVDFGLAFLIHSGEFTTSKTAGNSRWTAPELMSAEDEDVMLSFSTDVFAFVMAVIEVYTENRPFTDIKNDTTVFFAVISGKRPDIPANIKESGSLRRLIERCWD